MPLLGSQPVPLGGDPRVFLDTLALFVKAAEHSLRSSTFLISQRLERPERLAVLLRSQWHMTVLQQPARKTALVLTALLSAVPSARAGQGDVSIQPERNSPRPPCPLAFLGPHTVCRR